MFVVQLLFPVEDFDNECLISVLSFYSLWLVFSMNLETGFRQRSKRIYIYIYWNIGVQLKLIYRVSIFDNLTN